MRIATRIAVGLGCLWVSSSAQAQDVVRADWFTFAVQAFGEWTDNRDSVSETKPNGDDTGRFDYEKTDNVKYGIGPTINLRRDFQRTSLRGEYTPMFTWWDNPRIGQSQSELTHDAMLELRFNSGERLEFYARDNFKYLDDPDLYLGSEELPTDPGDKHVTQENSHLDNRASAGLQYTLSKRLYSTADTYWRIKRFDDALLADNGDEDSMGVSMSLMRQHSAYLSYGVNAGYDAYDRENVDDLPMGVESMTFGVGARYKANRYVDISGSYGYQFTQHENDEIDDREYPTDTKIELGITPSTRCRAVAGMTMSVVEGYVYPYVSQDRTAFYSALNYRHTSKFSSTLRLDYRQCTYEEKYTNPETPDSAFAGQVASRPVGSRDGDRDEVFAYAGLNYRWSDRLLLTGYYSYEDVSSDVNDSFERNTLGARARLEF